MKLLNRQKRAKKTPIPLTNDMLNELKVNHMGGADNYGVDDFYNIDDPWNDTKQPIKPKVNNKAVLPTYFFMFKESTYHHII